MSNPKETIDNMIGQNQTNEDNLHHFIFNVKTDFEEMCRENNAKKEIYRQKMLKCIEVGDDDMAELYRLALQGIRFENGIC